MTDPAIRAATAADAPALAALYRAAYGDLAAAGFPSSAAETDAAEVREWLADRECWLVDGAGVSATSHPHGVGDSDNSDNPDNPDDADDADDPDGGDTTTSVGVAAAIQLRDRDDWPCPEVCRLAVAPARQREGLGAALLDHAERVVAGRANGRVRLRSFTDHPFLLDWYAERGYERVDLQELDSRPFDVPVLERRL